MRRTWRFSFEEGGPQRLEIAEADEPGVIVLFDRMVATPTPITFPSVDATTLSLADGSELVLTASEYSELCVVRDRELLTGTELDLTQVAMNACKALAYPALMLIFAKFHGLASGEVDLATAVEVPFLLCVLVLAAVTGAGYRAALLAGAALLAVLGGADALYRGLTLRGLVSDAVTAMAVVLAVRGFRAMAPIQRWYSSRTLKPRSSPEPF